MVRFEIFLLWTFTVSHKDNYCVPFEQNILTSTHQYKKKQVLSHVLLHIRRRCTQVNYKREKVQCGEIILPLKNQLLKEHNS